MGRRVLLEHPLLTDALLAAALLLLSTAWLVWSPFVGLHAALLQAALVVPLAWRRLRPTGILLLVSGVALVQVLLGYQLIGDMALLVALYTVAVHESRLRTLSATVLLGVGAVLAAVEWRPAGTIPRSLLFLSATVVAALFAGLTVRSGSRYLLWLAERAERLELERDQQATIAATAERTRIHAGHARHRFSQPVSPHHVGGRRVGRQSNRSGSALRKRSHRYPRWAAKH